MCINEYHIDDIINFKQEGTNLLVHAIQQNII